MSSKLYLISFPLAPSANDSYFAIGKGRMAPTAHHRAFMRAVEVWANGRPDTIENVKLELEAWLRRGDVIRVDAWFVFERSRLWTVDGKVKTLDANNRLKPALDGLKEALGIDDRFFFAGNAEKVSCALPEHERTVFRLTAMKPLDLTGLWSECGLNPEVNLADLYPAPQVQKITQKGRVKRESPDGPGPAVPRRRSARARKG